MNFFALKNPTVSAGFEPANFGTKGQHATSRPPKPLKVDTEATGNLVQELSLLCRKLVRIVANHGGAVREAAVDPVKNLRSF